MTFTRFLSWDHDRIDRLMDEVVAMTNDGELERADHIFLEVREALHRHITFEEEALFPLIESRAGATGPVAVMRREHLAIHAALEKMRCALGEGRPAAFHDARAELGDVLRPHNLKEERILYPLADAVATDSERRNLLDALRAQGVAPTADLDP